MNWQFWKNKSSVRRFQINNHLPLLEKDNKEDSFSFWKRELPYGNYKLIELNTFETSLSSYDMILKDEISNALSMINTDINKIIEKAVLKNKTLNDLHETLGNLDKECKEEGFQVFTEQAEKNARRVLNGVYEQFPDYEYYIYPTENREIAIDCNPYKGKGVLILCDSNNGIACFVTLEGRNHRFQYDSIDDFPFDLLWETFEEFDKEKKYLSDDITGINFSAYPSSRESFFFKQQKIFGGLSNQYECA